MPKIRSVVKKRTWQLLVNATFFGGIDIQHGCRHYNGIENTLIANNPSNTGITNEIT